MMRAAQPASASACCTACERKWQTDSDSGKRIAPVLHSLLPQYALQKVRAAQPASPSVAQPANPSVVHAVQ